jgi:hypothetical protein
VLGDELAGGIDACESRHGFADTPPTSGLVAGISVVHCQFDPEPVPGSGLLTEVQVAEKWTADQGDRQFAGFLVRLATIEEDTA